jgi:hypothetical protein
MFSTPFAFMAAPVGGAFAYLLDDYPSAGIAYSLRLLRSAYAGNCIEVRRSSDNTTLNIGFVNNVLDDASLLTFCGAGDGFVKTWYDQSGNAVNATQTTNGEQPRIVNAGIIETQNGLPSVRFPGDRFMRFTASITQPDTVFIVVQHDGTNTEHIFDSQARQLIGYTPGFVMYAGSSIVSYPTTPLTFQLVSALFDGANSNFQSNNGTTQTGDPGTAVINSTQIMRGQGSVGAAVGFMSEFVVYASDQTSNKTGIKTNINDFYSIF